MSPNDKNNMKKNSANNQNTDNMADATPSRRRSMGDQNQGHVNRSPPRTGSDMPWAVGFYGKLGRAAMHDASSNARKRSPEPVAGGSSQGPAQVSNMPQGNRHHVRHQSHSKDPLSFNTARDASAATEATADDDALEHSRSDFEPAANNHHHQRRRSHSKNPLSLMGMGGVRGRSLTGISEDTDSESLVPLLRPNSNDSEAPERNASPSHHRRKFSQSWNPISSLTRQQVSRAGSVGDTKYSRDIMRTTTVEVTSGPADDQASNPAKVLTDYFYNYFDTQVEQKADGNVGQSVNKGRKKTMSGMDMLAATMGYGVARDIRRF